MSLNEKSSEVIFHCL